MLFKHLKLKFLPQVKQIIYYSWTSYEITYTVYTQDVTKRNLSFTFFVSRYIADIVIFYVTSAFLGN
jgi:hypothetical protein